MKKFTTSLALELKVEKRLKGMFKLLSEEIKFKCLVGSIEQRGYVTNCKYFPLHVGYRKGKHLNLVNWHGEIESGALYINDYTIW